MAEPEYEVDADGSLWRVMSPELLDGSFTGIENYFKDAGRGVPVGARVRIPQGTGRGTVETIKVRDHLYVMRVDAEFDRDFRLVGESRMAKVRILLSGELTAEGSQIKLKGAGAYLEVYPGQSFRGYVLAGGCRTRLLILNLRPEFFAAVANLPPSSMPEPLASLVNGSSEEPQASHTPLGPDLLRAANDIMRAESHYPGALRNAYLSAKCQEIACSIVRELSIGSVEHPPQGLSVRDVNRIYEARDILADNFQRPPTIPKLARQIGVNQTKLKSAFKAVFGLTLADFTMKCRMERAGEMLSGTDLSVAEIAYAVGYDHPPNLTHAFRRYYGHTPRELRQAKSTIPGMEA